MKSKELIRRLLEIDPDGETEVCCGNHDIYFLDRLPAYYDGKLQLIITDPEKDGKCYSIIGGKVMTSGQKINIVTMGISDILIDNPEMPVDLSDVREQSHEYCWHKKVEAMRKEYRELNAELEKKYPRKT